jgi:hypothetical protein
MAIVKLDAEHKQKLERYLAHLLFKKGKKVTMQRALGEMIDHALRCEDFKKEFETEALPPLEKDPAWIALNQPLRTGIKDLSENIDKYLYG